jgi:hypothetical protein
MTVQSPKLTVKPLLAIVSLLALAACGAFGGLRNSDSGQNGPDEFGVLPSLPLEIPSVLTLPPPTPGGVNRTDRNPVAEAIIALGGRPSAAQSARSSAAAAPAPDTPPAN